MSAKIGNKANMRIIPALCKGQFYEHATIKNTVLKYKSVYWKFWFKNERNEAIMLFSGWRPGVVFQNNIGNAKSPNIIALPLTTCLKKLNMPTHVLVRADESGLKKDSMVLCENPERMSRSTDFFQIVNLFISIILYPIFTLFFTSLVYALVYFLIILF